MKSASIPAETPDGRVDFHSLRVTFVTGLARGGVHPRKAMQLARHSSIELTMRVYTKLQTTELASCLDVLPDTPDSAAPAKAG
ncbi:MAG: tyrosine-type recombinase/integrase [Planctomycetes bacterium]|nr:tyrosine-type recombinase/integrase [Planctomycetota bacterium]